MTAYYNENDPQSAAWLRELIAEGLIARGDVDERSIVDVTPSDVAGYTQCHFFAGIGVWSYALRNAGWPDATPVWTGSCPCQSFSASGKRGGFSDKRHLWPIWFRLIEECRPDTIFGEQVASKDGLAWLDVVSADLEAAGYAIGTADLCAAGLGAPHIRQRLYFVADAAGIDADAERLQPSWQQRLRAESGGGDGAKGISEWPEVDRLAQSGSQQDLAATVGGFHADAGSNGADGKLADSQNADRRRGERRTQAGTGQNGERRRGSASDSLTNGFWADAVWLYCRDNKYRPTQPEIFPLAPRTPGRVGLLRGAGNALCAPVATAFIQAYIEVRKVVP